MLYDIHEVCVMLDTTSRTLRYYEEKGLITCEKDPFSPRRRYTAEQVDRIRNILALRALGLSLKTIAALQRQDTDLKAAMLSRRAQILASVDQKAKEIALLNETLAMLDKGENILQMSPHTALSVFDKYHEQIVRECVDAMLNGDTNTLYRHISSKLAAYLPPSVYEQVWHDTVASLGDWEAYGVLERDAVFGHILYQHVRYADMGLRITFVFHAGLIDGLWLSYEEW